MNNIYILGSYKKRGESERIGVLLKYNHFDDDLLSDYDGIFMYNTDANDNDTDDDLLSDYDEIFTYNTNPNKIDTDGDSF